VVDKDQTYDNNRRVFNPFWPLPLWVTVIPSFILAIFTFWYAFQAGNWAYVAPARLSGMLRESLMISGPLVAALAAWVANGFTNRYSLQGASHLPKVTVFQRLRLLFLLAVTWSSGFLIGGLFSVWLIMRRATGGAIYPLEFTIATISLCWFVIVGFSIGTIVSRWWSPLLVLAIGYIWVYIVPLFYSIFVPSTGSNIEYFMFPAIAAQDHRSLAPAPLAVILLWWIVQLSVLLFMLGSWYQWISRANRNRFPICVVALFCIAACGLLISNLSASPFRDNFSENLVCQSVGSDSNLQVCVTSQQQPVISSIIAEVPTILERMGSAFPEHFTTVLSYQALPIALAQGNPAEQILPVNVGIDAGATNVALDLAVNLSGFSACLSNQGGSATPFVVGLTAWIADGQAPLDWASNPDYIRLNDLPVQTVRQWYSDNSSDILTCQHVSGTP